MTASPASPSTTSRAKWRSGLVAGVLGKLIMPGRDPGGFVVTILLAVLLRAVVAPLLLVAGETADGVNPLVDRQHPHDLFMELSASYSKRLSDKDSVYGYIGLPGEPAFGPPAFMRRTSSGNTSAALPIRATDFASPLAVQSAIIASASSRSCALASQ